MAPSLEHLNGKEFAEAQRLSVMPRPPHAYSLSIPERMQLLTLLPAEGNIVTLRVVRALQAELSFSEQEIADFGISLSGERATWDVAKARDKDVQIGPAAMKLIVEALTKANEAGKLHIAYLPLYERFV